MRYALQAALRESIGSDGTAVKNRRTACREHPHPRYYGTFPRILGRYVRDEKVITLEEAIRKMTSANAAKIGIYDRGLIRPGLWADVTVFNAETVIDNATWEQPHQYAFGHRICAGEWDRSRERRAHECASGSNPLWSGVHCHRAGSNGPASDRAAAEWVIRSGGNVRIAVTGNSFRPSPICRTGPSG